MDRIRRRFSSFCGERSFTQMNSVLVSGFCTPFWLLFADYVAPLVGFAESEAVSAEYVLKFPRETANPRSRIQFVSTKVLSRRSGS